MKKARKLLVALLVLTFLLGTFNVGFVAAAEEDLPSHVVRAIALGYLKGFEDGDLKLDQPITRAQALAFIIRISGLDSSAELMKGQTQFADVNNDPSLQWATGYINLGVGQGIVNGYPDGTFKGNNNVTYAEMAKMILYAMNYGVTVEGGQWPAAVMGKADDLDIFDKVNALPNLPALRGDVVKMIDNSLTINHLVQKGYGDLAYYDEGDDTFLSKLNVEELEDVRVTDIARVNNKLDDDEIELTEYDKDGDPVDSDIYTLIADVKPEAIFGLKVDAWVNDDDEVFFVEIKTAEKDIIYDTVAKSTDGANKIDLLVEDEDYKVSKDAEIYVDFAGATILSGGSVSLPELQYAYGRFVLERGEIVFANLFEFDENGVVTSVTDEKIEYFKDSDTTRKLILDDYDAYYIYDKNFNSVDLDYIDEDTAIFWFENDDDEIFIIAVNDKVEGELTRAKDDEITVDGEKYKTSKVSNATISSNANDDIVKYVAAADATEDLLGEEVVVILDVNGRVRHIVGDAESVSGTNYGIVTDAYRSGKYYYANIFTKDGEEVEYKFEKNDDGQAVVEKLGKNDTHYLVIKFKLNADGEIDESFDVSDDILTDVVDVTEFDDDDDVIEFDGGAELYVTSSTILMNAEPIEHDDDPELVKWDDIKGKSVDTVKAIYDASKKDIKFIVFTKGIESAASDLEFAVVTSAPWRESDGWKVELDVFGEGKQEFYLDKSDDRTALAKGDLVAFNLTSKNKIKTEFKVNRDIEKLATPDDKTNYAVTNAVYKVDGNYIILKETRGGDDPAFVTTWTRISKDAVVYTTGKTLGNRDLDKAKSYSDITVGDVLEVVVNKRGDIVLALIYKK